MTSTRLPDRMTSDPEALQIATIYLATFAPRTDAYAAHTGSGWIAVHAELTPELLIGCLTEGRPVSISAYMLAPDSTSHVLALDLDLSDGLELARRVQRVMANAGVPGYVEPSRRGAHLWCVLAARLPGIVLRRALRTFVADAAIAPTPQVELRPAQDRLARPDSIGSALRMPTMPHPLTGLRYPLHDPGGTSLGLKVAPMLLSIELASPSAIVTAAERWSEPALPPVRGHLHDGPSPIEVFNARVGVSAVLSREWGVPNAVPGRSIRCPAHDDRSPSLSIAPDDSRAWCHSPSCDLHGPNGAGHDAYGLVELARTRSAS
jgi:hypothetical protein